MSRQFHDKLFLALIRTISFISIVCLLFIILFLVSEALPAILQITPEYFSIDNNWLPGENRFSLLPMIAGSLFIMIGTMIIAFPLGVLVALFSKYYSPPGVAFLIQRIIEIMSGIPSVVYGFWGVITIVPLVASIQGPGTSLLAGILVLTLIVMPGITIIALHNLSQINTALIHSALALGMTRYTIIRYIILPEVRRSLLTGMSLQSGRAIGETLAVLMVCGNVVQIPGNIFEPVRTLTSNIALEMAYAMDMHRSALFLSGLMLLILVLALTVSSEIVNRDKMLQK